MSETRRFEYHAVIGGGSEDPIFCSDVDGHPRHGRVEEAGACLGLSALGSSGKVYETADGVFTDTYFVFEKRGPIPGVLTKNGSEYQNKKRP